MRKQNHYNKLTEEEKEKLKKKLADNPPEKGDGLALIIAALITFVPALLLVVGAFLAVIWFFFLR